MKCRGSTWALQRELSDLSAQEVGGIRRVAEMLRYDEELRLRRQPAVAQLTLKLESVGIEQD